MTQLNTFLPTNTPAYLIEVKDHLPENIERCYGTLREYSFGLPKLETLVHDHFLDGGSARNVEQWQDLLIERSGQVLFLLTWKTCDKIDILPANLAIIFPGSDHTVMEEVLAIIHEYDILAMGAILDEQGQTPFSITQPIPVAG